MDILIRSENPQDQEAIFEVNKAAFGQENEGQLVDALRLNEGVFVPELSLVAEESNQIIGHILFSKITIIKDQHNSHESLALAPMAVIPAKQNQGIGEQMILEGLKRARELGFKSVIVLGHEHYYPKFGFLPAERWQIKAPFDVPQSAFMAIELSEGSLQGISGVVQYPPEFNVV